MQLFVENKHKTVGQGCSKVQNVTFLFNLYSELDIHKEKALFKIILLLQGDCASNEFLLLSYGYKLLMITCSWLWFPQNCFELQSRTLGFKCETWQFFQKVGERSLVYETYSTQVCERNSPSYTNLISCIIEFCQTAMHNPLQAHIAFCY